MAEDLKLVFAEQYGSRDPTHLVCAPGRVNLIGEHIDYNGLPVLPMALGRRVSVLLRARDDALVRIANVNDAFPPLSFTMSPTIEPYPAGAWGNYVKAAAQELALHHAGLTGFDAVVGSNIPIASGLSSSSALVVASALAVVQGSGVSVEPIELMEMLARAERYVGTQGGGMDQAICLGAREGTAARIEFSPLRLTHTTVPPGWRFVVAFSLIRAEKSGAVRDAYNDRTQQCQDALNSVIAKLGLTSQLDTYPKLLARISIGEILKAADRALTGATARRFRHVVTEARRVADAEQAMRDNDIERFGYLMVESHRSLRDDYEVSCVELDALTEIATSGGACGARLTGAGFGGCAIALCSADRVGAVQDALTERFYATREYAGKLEDHLFVAEPSGGASVTAV